MKLDQYVQKLLVMIILLILSTQISVNLNLHLNNHHFQSESDYRTNNFLRNLDTLREDNKRGVNTEIKTGFNYNNQVMYSTSDFIGPPNQTGNELIESISITSDNEFKAVASAMGWKGTGNPYDPIIIENYNFSLNSPSTRLLMQDTSIEFIIRNCVFENAANLTTFYNVSNGILRGNIFQNATSYGLFLDEFGLDNRIVHNIFENNATGGINAFNDNDTNEFYYNWWDIHSGGSAGGIFYSGYSVPGYGASLEQGSRVYKQYWNVDEMILMSNAQLDWNMFNKGFLGNGTEENPYRIQYVNFSFAMETPLIDISNVDKYLVLEDCYFDANYMVTAINMNSASNIEIKNCTILKGAPGINADSVSNFFILDCSINESGTHGFYGTNINDLFMIDCSITDSGSDGFYGSNINDSIIDSLSIYKTQSQGLFFRYSNNVSVRNSQMENITYTGLFFQYSSDIIVNNCIVQNCLAVNSRGIRCDNVDEIRINNTEVHNISGYAVYLYYTSNSTINNSEISFSSIGLFTYTLGDCNISSTTIWNHTRYGIEVMPGENNNTFSDLDIFNCDTGMKITDTRTNVLMYNRIHHNNIGIELDGEEGETEFTSIFWNNVTSNYGTGILLTFAAENLISSNRIQNNNKGVECTSFSENNTFYQNTFLNNEVVDNGTTNYWDNGSYGNYWDTYFGIDADGDGFGDTPYSIPGSANAFDNFPLVSLIPLPEIVLTVPQNSSIINSYATLEFLFLNSNGTYIYNWDGSSNQTASIEEPIPLPATEGLHTLAIYLSNGQTWTKERYMFTLDNTDPVIESWDNLHEGSEVGAGTTLTFSIIDLHFENFWYVWNTTHGSLPVVSSDIPWVEVPNITGDWTLRIYANDTAGNEHYNSITVTVLAPVDMTLIYPNGGEDDGGYINITWVSSEDLTYNLQYSPDGGYTWVTLSESLNSTFYIWDTATPGLNGSTYLVRIRSITPGKPGEIRSETSFSIVNIIKKYLPVGTTDIKMPDINISITVSEATNVTIQRLTQVVQYMTPNKSDYYNYGLFIDIILENQDALEVLIVSFSVAHLLDTLTAQGLEIYDIEVFFYNDSSHEWEPADETAHNKTLSLVIGTFNHTTTIGALGRAERPTISEGEFPFFFILLIVLSLSGVAGGALLIYEHQLKMQSGELSILSQIEKYLKELQRRLGKEE